MFDDDLRTRPLKWNNYVDIVIIAMIVLSTVSVFLTTFTLSPAWEKAVNIFDWIVQIFFTIEVSLRIWAADEIDPKYKGFWGRVRYCFSFYGLIDVLATYPILIGMACPSLMLSSKLFQIFRVLRIARLFHVFRYMPAFRFLGEAFGSKKKEIFVSLQFLVIITIVLSFILFLLERDENPEMLGDGWRSIVWSFAKYIGDPGKIVDQPLVTTGGKIISFLVGILGIAIFAVPIGLLSSGFSEAMENEKHHSEIEKFYQRMQKSFRHTIDKTLRSYLNTLPDGGGEQFKILNFVPSSVPVARLQIRQGIELKDIFEVCEKHHEFRIKNLSEAMNDEYIADDRFVLEHCPLNRPYGYRIKRNSKVTIVATSSVTECGTGWFTYYLALLGGFNYVSKDIEVNFDELDSYFNLKDYDADDKKNANRKAFISDIKDLAKDDDSWVILFTTHIKSIENTFDFHFADARKDGSDSTVHDQQRYQQFLHAFDHKMQSECQLSSSLQSERYYLTKNNLGYKLKEENLTCNTFVLRPSCDIVNFDIRKLAIAFRMAQLISEHFDNNRGPRPEDIDEMRQGGFGYPNEKKDKKA